MGNKILAFDTALFGCGVALWDQETGACWKQVKAMARGQAEILVPMIEEVLAEAQIPFADIDLIATTTGPGAFTGLRIGLATAKTLGLVLDKPVVGCTTLAVLAHQYLAQHSLAEDQKLAVLLETKRRDYYWQIFDRQGLKLTEPGAHDGPTIAKRLDQGKGVIIGDALARFSSETGEMSGWNKDENFALIDPEALAGYALQRWEEQGPEAFATPPSPLYLRPADVSKPKRKPRDLVGYND